MLGAGALKGGGRQVSLPTFSFGFNTIILIVSSGSISSTSISQYEC